MNRWAVALLAFFNGEVKASIFFKALASASGLRVNRAALASAWDSLFLETAIAIILEKSGDKRTNTPMKRSMSGCMPPLSFKFLLGLMPPYLQVLTAQSESIETVPTRTVTTVMVRMSDRKSTRLHS